MNTVSGVSVNFSGRTSRAVLAAGLLGIAIAGAPSLAQEKKSGPDVVKLKEIGKEVEAKVYTVKVGKEDVKVFITPSNHEFFKPSSEKEVVSWEAIRGLLKEHVGDDEIYNGKNLNGVHAAIKDDDIKLMVNGKEEVVKKGTPRHKFIVETVGKLRWHTENPDEISLNPKDLMYLAAFTKVMMAEKGKKDWKVDAMDFGTLNMNLQGKLFPVRDQGLKLLEAMPKKDIKEKNEKEKGPRTSYFTPGGKGRSYAMAANAPQKAQVQTNVANRQPRRRDRVYA
jgi:hypothetical protein